jgi:cell division protein FtsB
MVTQISKLRKKKREKFQNMAVAVFLVLVVVIFVGFLVFHNIRIYQKRAELSKQTQILQERIEESQARNQEVQEGIQERQTQEYQERILREQGLYQKEGEEVFTVVRPEIQEQQEVVQEKKIWWDPRTWLGGN